MKLGEETINGQQGLTKWEDISTHGAQEQHAKQGHSEQRHSNELMHNNYGCDTKVHLNQKLVHRSSLITHEQYENV